MVRDPREVLADWTSLVDHVSRCVRHLPSRFVSEQDRDDLAQTVLVRLLQSLHRPLDETVEPVWNTTYVATCVRNEARRAWRHRSTLTGSIETWTLERLDTCIEVAAPSTVARSAREDADALEQLPHPVQSCPRTRGRSVVAFSPFQSRVIELKLQGLSIHAIATVVDRKRCQVQAAWKQVQRKLGGSAPTVDAPDAEALPDMDFEVSQ